MRKTRLPKVKMPEFGKVPRVKMPKAPRMAKAKLPEAKLPKLKRLLK